MVSLSSAFVVSSNKKLTRAMPSGSFGHLVERITWLDCSVQYCYSMLYFYITIGMTVVIVALCAVQLSAQ